MLGVLGIQQLFHVFSNCCYRSFRKENLKRVAKTQKHLIDQKLTNFVSVYELTALFKYKSLPEWYQHCNVKEIGFPIGNEITNIREIP